MRRAEHTGMRKKVGFRRVSLFKIQSAFDERSSSNGNTRNKRYNSELEPVEKFIKSIKFIK